MTAAVIQGDARRLPLPDASVDLVVTSPPYFGLRDYRDGDASMVGQIGSEATPGEWLAALVDCTREWARVLKPSGSIFVNLGDKYAGGGGGNYGADSKSVKGREGAHLTNVHNRKAWLEAAGAQPKSLLGLPWRYALACTDQLGLILRRDIIWSKPNGLPESVTDRCRSSHEYVFHLVRQPRYYAAVDEIREPHSGGSHMACKDKGPSPWSLAILATGDHGMRHSNTDPSMFNPLGKLPGSVWDIPSQPLTVPPELGIDHFAAFPMELPRRIILGWSPPGVCIKCGEGRRPVAEAEAAVMPSWALSQRQGRSWHADGADPKRALGVAAVDRSRVITGYSCACPRPDAHTRPAVVLDPFGGTGTTALVAAMHGRHGITIDRSADYSRLARWRTRDPAERARALGVAKPPPVPAGQVSLFDLDGEAS